MGKKELENISEEEKHEIFNQIAQMCGGETVNLDKDEAPGIDLIELFERVESLEEFVKQCSKFMEMLGPKVDTLEQNITILLHMLVKNKTIDKTTYQKAVMTLFEKTNNTFSSMFEEEEFDKNPMSEKETTCNCSEKPTKKIKKKKDK